LGFTRPKCSSIVDCGVPSSKTKNTCVMKAPL
jgi:hypothetical protein